MGWNGDSRGYAIRFAKACAWTSAFLIASCGGDNSGETPPTAEPPPPPVTSDPPKVSLPDYAYADPETTVSITADASDDLGITAYAWQQISGPEVGLTGADTKSVTIEVPAVTEGGEVGLEVEVRDAQDQTASALIILRVNPDIASAEPASVVVDAPASIPLEGGDSLLVVSGRLITPYPGTGSVSIKADPDYSPLVALTDGQGTPRLVTLEPLRDGQVSLSSESSAIAYVLRSPRFFGLKISNYAGLAEQIEAHTNFPDLVETITERIATSPCPMSRTCNVLGAELAELIAQDIETTNFVVEAK